MIDTQMTPKTLNHCAVHLDPSARGYVPIGEFLLFYHCRIYRRKEVLTYHLPRIELLPLETHLDKL